MKRFWLACCIVLFLAISWWAPGSVAHAASYDDNPLTDYNIPVKIIQVLLDNSQYANGDSPTDRGQTPVDFTVKDLEDLTTVSLATRTTASDGAVTSTANATVASWVASLEKSTGYEIDDGAYAQNTTALVTGDSGSLATKQIMVYGTAYQSSFNFLMQLIASADNAKIVDLSGVTSQVTDSTLVEELLCLLQTDRLSSLQSLLLANDNLTSTTFYKMDSTLFNVTSDQNVTTLDLSNNNMTFEQNSFNQNTFSIMAKLTNLNLAGNDVTLVQGWLADAITKIANNAGSSDMSGSHLDADDYNTLNTMMTLLNSNTGDFQLSDDSVNALFQAVPSYNTAWQPNAELIQKYLSQLTTETVTKLLTDDPAVSTDSDLKQALEDIQSGKTTTANALAVTGSWDFGTSHVANVAKTLTSTGTAAMTATVTSGSTLSVAMAPWVGTSDGSTFDGQLVLPATTAYWGETTVSTTTQALYTNTTNAAVTLNQAIADVQFRVPEDQQAKVTSQGYTSTITWTLSDSVS